MSLLTKALIFLWSEIQTLLFPQCCLICGKVNSTIWCKQCKREVCQKVIFKIENKNEKEYYFSKHISIFLYEGKIRTLLLDYKFRDKSYLYKIFSKIIIKNTKICGILKKYDIIIPVPIHKKRKKQRGYNQTALIAREMATYIDELRCEETVVEKIKHTLPQSTLKKEQRKQNVQNVYKVKKKQKIEHKRIILFDDIYTTGSTVNSVAKILKENGAKEILVLTIAKD